MLKHTFSVLKHASKGIKRACNMLAVGMFVTLILLAKCKIVLNTC